jgi:hypothetical protein
MEPRHILLPTVMSQKGSIKVGDYVDTFFGRGEVISIQLDMVLVRFEHKEPSWVFCALALTALDLLAEIAE